MQEMLTIQGYLDGYINFLKDYSSETKINNKVTKIVLPFLDSLNDCTEIYIIKNDNNYIVTDDGETITNLSFNGVEIKGPSREGIFQKILNSYGVMRKDDALYINANEADLYLKKHLLLQCINKVNDMYILNRSNVKNIFIEDVKLFFDKNDILYVPDHRLTGISGLTANYDFAIPKRKQEPFTLIKTLNDLTKDKVKATVFDWNDTKESCYNS
jgi:hypothetical protein